MFGFGEKSFAERSKHDNYTCCKKNNFFENILLGEKSKNVNARSLTHPPALPQTPELSHLDRIVLIRLDFFQNLDFYLCGTKSAQIG